MRNGGVSNVRDGGEEAVWAELQSALAEAVDDRYSDLHQHAEKAKEQLTTADGKGYVGPGEFDVQVLAREIDAAAHECVDLEDAGLVD